MISQLRGKLIAKSPGEVVVEVNGVGYGLQVPLSTFYDLPDVGEEVELLVHTQLKDESLCLFGFLTQREKELFRLMIGVSGIGPRLALTVLSGISAEELERALLEGDVLSLSSIPGIGRKTAERMVVELRDRVAETRGRERMPHGGEEMMRDALSALMNLGYNRSVAERALRQAKMEKEASSLEELLRESLRILAKTT
ncbi:MAG: Holliday junction branch migration protein RuvA [Deltaproteobacteria bacterium]|nr:MAG: Holliday junction branch migration protein RuvA [Deltaproteobacteria bacterium]